ncbi:MAG: diacylglycerol kinase [Alkalinema sp. CACIAM 70d]|nr:MAG: diacylglycerol kinase [Alkalinema sp. CACIAM 70d]
MNPSINPKVLCIFNPHAGQAQFLQKHLPAAIDLWSRSGWQVDLAPTQFAGHATQIAQQAAEQGYDIAIAAGGDGTVNEVMNGLVNTQTALGVLPIGTVNIWAREMGLPMDVLGAAQGLATAQVRTIDVGRAGDRYFLLMAGVGFDAAVTETIKPHEKKRLGAIAYIKQALHTAWQFQGVRTLLRIDGKRIRGRILMIVIGNSQLYGGVVKMTAHAVVDDGLLDVCVIKGRSMMVAPLRLFSIFTRNYNRDPKVEYYHATRIEIQGKKHLPVQVDGDFIGRTPLRFEVVPSALQVLVPEKADRSLFCQSY